MSLRSSTRRATLQPSAVYKTGSDRAWLWRTLARRHYLGGEALRSLSGTRLRLMDQVRDRLRRADDGPNRTEHFVFHLLRDIRDHAHAGTPRSVVSRNLHFAQAKAIVCVAQAHGALPDVLLISHGTGPVRDRDGDDEAIATVTCSAIWPSPFRRHSALVYRACGQTNLITPTATTCLPTGATGCRVWRHWQLRISSESTSGVDQRGGRSP
jgi:hypothetical protein